MSFDFAIRAGFAASKDNFCIALHSMDDEDPYSIILVYNSARERPWNRIDVNRNIYDVSYLQSEKKFTALTDEGEVYFIDPDGKVSQENIKGAGLNASHSEGRGATMKIRTVDETLFVVGLGNQFFKRTRKDEWSFVELPNLEGNFEDVDYSDVNGSGANDLYVVGTANPQENGKGGSDLIGLSAEARLAGDEVLAKKLYAEFYNNIQDSQGVAFYFNGDEWEEADLYESEIDSIYADSSEKAFFGTKNSGIYFGNNDDGFDDIDTAKNVRSITILREKIIFIAESALYMFTEEENAEVEPLKIKAPKGKAPLPLRIQAVDDVMICFDFNLGVYTWDGDKTWTNIPIPEELMDRDYDG